MSFHGMDGKFQNLLMSVLTLFIFHDGKVYEAPKTVKK